MKLYECPTHDQEFNLGILGGCPHCSRIVEAIKRQTEMNQRVPSPKNKLQSSVYWPTEMGFSGRTIENLGNKPQHFALKRDYRNYLKKNKIQEAG